MKARVKTAKRAATKTERLAAPDPTRGPTLRERHQDTTRDVIVDALVDLLENSGPFEFSFFELGRRAGVSVRTVYRYFPTRELLFDAVSARVNERVGFREYPENRDGIVELTRRLFPAFDREAALIRAQMQTGLGRSLRTHAQKLRTQKIVEAVKDIAPDLEPARQRQVGGAISCLMSADAWLRLRNALDMKGEEAGEAVAWAIDTLFAAVQAEGQRVAAARKSNGKKKP
jgi:AcrR family transcriptional regulator